MSLGILNTPGLEGRQKGMKEAEASSKDMV